MIHGMKIFLNFVLYLMLRVMVLHKKVQELRNEKLVILKNAENERLNWEENRAQLLNQLTMVHNFSSYSRLRILLTILDGWSCPARP